MSKRLHGLDAVSGGVLLLMVVLAPWMLGTTTQETIAVLNGMGLLLGALWITKCVVRRNLLSGSRPNSVALGRR